MGATDVKAAMGSHGRVSYEFADHPWTTAGASTAGSPVTPPC